MFVKFPLFVSLLCIVFSDAYAADDCYPLRSETEFAVKSHQTGDDEPAIALFARLRDCHIASATASNREAAAAALVLGGYEMKRLNYAKAAEHFKQATRLDPSNDGYRNALAKAQGKPRRNK